MQDIGAFLTFIFFGFVAIAVLQTLVPVAIQLTDKFIVWLVRRPAARARKWGTLGPVEQNLQRVSHGVAYIVLPLAAVWLIGPQTVGGFLSNFVPAIRLCIIGACVVGFITAISRCAGGWKLCAGVRDSLLAKRALAKWASGAALLALLHYPPVGWDVRNGGVLMELALLLIPLWMIVTGLVRFIVLARPAEPALPKVKGNIDDNEFDWDK